MATIRKSNVITKKEDIDFLLNLTQRDLESLSMMMETFGVINNGKPRFNTYDIVTIPPNSYGPEGKRNKNAFVTTVGRWWFNKTFIERDLFDLFKYINKPIDKKMLNYINQEISYAIIEDRLDVASLKRYLMRQQKFQPYSNILCSGFSELMLNMSDITKAKKQQLLKKYEKELKDPMQNMYASDKIEKELLDYSKEILKDDVSMDMYKSGAKGKFENNFKNIFIMKGAVKDPDPTKGYDVITSNYIDGISNEDYSKMAKSLSAGPYNRTQKTPKGGYFEKLFLRGLQHLKLAPKGTDCKTKRTITVTLTKDIIPLLMYSFIVEGNNLIELTTANKDKYLNKTVQMRFSSLCEYDKDGQTCNACAGNLYYRLGFENVGAATPQIASKLKLVALKAFHDSTVKLHTIDVMKAFGYKKEEK